MGVATQAPLSTKQLSTPLDMDQNVLVPVSETSDVDQF
jgi:hypothetical protein